MIKLLLLQSASKKEEKSKGRNPQFLSEEVPLCPEPDGYEYPVPENPLTLPTKPTTTQPTLPECIISEERNSGNNPSYIEKGVPICPEEYEDYDPSDIPSDQAEPPPDCVPEDEKDEDHNRVHLDNGISICPKEGYEYPVPEIPFTLPPKVKRTTTTTTTTVMITTTTTTVMTTTTTTTTTEPLPE